MKNTVILLLSFILLACNPNQGTDTGNPGNNGGSCGGPRSISARCAYPTRVNDQVMQICRKLEACLGADFSKCYDQVFTQPGLRYEIQMDVNSFRDMDRLFREKKVSIDSDHYNTCMTKTIDLTCDSPILLDAFSAQDPANYSNIHRILRADIACKSIYSPKE